MKSEDVILIVIGVGVLGFAAYKLLGKPQPMPLFSSAPGTTTNNNAITIAPAPPMDPVTPKTVLDRILNPVQEVLLPSKDSYTTPLPSKTLQNYTNTPTENNPLTINPTNSRLQGFGMFV